MSEDQSIIKKPVSIIKEIETQLENYLRQQREEIEKALEERIQKEKELAQQQLIQIEEKVKQEWQSLEEYGNLWEEMEGERNQLLEQIQAYLQKIGQRQEEIEKLARETAEDIKAINQLQQRLEEIRSQSMEKAAFLKKQLEEKFGLKTELAEKEGEASAPLDLTPELEKLKKIKELLILENKTDRPVIDLVEEREKENEDQQLEKTLTEEIKKNLIEKQAAAAQKEPEQDNPEPERRTERMDVFGRSDLAEYYRQETANGSGEIGYYQKGRKNIIDVDELLSRIRVAVEEARKLANKLSFITSAKEQFYLKQELISTQEHLKRYLQRVLSLMNRKSFRFLALTQELINQAAIEDLINLLGVQNWNSAEDLAFFEQKIIFLINSFKSLTTPPSIYYAALKKELEI
ncbi:MAG: hypothetical protein ACPLZD_08115 [Candidatus Saccharicenans sp.]